MITSTISQRGQTTVPKQVRDALSVGPGKQLIYDIEGDLVIIRAHPGVSSSIGVFKKYCPEQSWDEVRGASRAEWIEHIAEEGSGS